MCEMCDKSMKGAREPMFVAMADQGYSQGKQDVNRYLSATYDWVKAPEGSTEKDHAGTVLAMLGRSMSPIQLQIAMMLLATSFIELIVEKEGSYEAVDAMLEKHNAEHAESLKELGDF